MLRLITFLLFCFNLTIADDEHINFIHSLNSVEFYLEGKISKSQMLKMVNSKLPMKVRLENVLVDDSGDKKEIRWIVKTNWETSQTKTFTSTYSKPYKRHRIVRSLKALQKLSARGEKPVKKVTKVETSIVDKIIKTKKTVMSASIQANLVNITNGQTELSFNVLKGTGTYGYSWDTGFGVSASLSGVQFRDVIFSEAIAGGDFTKSFLEYGFSVFKNFDSGTFSFNVNQLNYVLLIDENISSFLFEPQSVSRYSIYLGYLLNDHWRVNLSAGTIVHSLASGTDYSAGISFLFGKNGRYSVSTSYYTSKLNIKSAGEDVSQAGSASLGIRF